MKRKNLKQTLKLIALAFFGIVLGAMACELLLEYLYNKEQARIAKQVEPHYSWTFYTPDKKRISTRKGPLELMIHPKMGYVNFPNQQTEFFSINSRGFRGPEIDSVRTHAKRIVLLGGSAAFGSGLRSDDETFASQLAHLLDGAEVINAAVIGHRSGQELSYLVSEIIDLQPDLIIALDGYNDYGSRNAERWIDMNGATQIEHQLNSLNGFVYGGFFTRMTNVAKIPFARTLDRLAILQTRIQRYLDRTQNDSGPEDDPHVALNEAASMFTTNIWKMHHISEAFSARFLCVLQPTKKWTANREDGLYTDFRDQVKGRLAQDSIAVIDLSDHAEAFTEDMFMDDLHMDARGNQVMASIVAQKVMEEGLLQNLLGEISDSEPHMMEASDQSDLPTSH